MMSIRISIQVRDQEIPVKRNYVKVVVHVEDCNDQPPAFLSPRYEASVSNRAPTGSEVVRVKALDKDTGSNAEIRYALYTGESNKFDFVFSSERIRRTSVVSTHLMNLNGCVEERNRVGQEGHIIKRGKKHNLLKDL